MGHLLDIGIATNSVTKVPSTCWSKGHLPCHAMPYLPRPTLDLLPRPSKIGEPALQCRQRCDDLSAPYGFNFARLCSQQTDSNYRRAVSYWVMRGRFMTKTCASASTAIEIFLDEIYDPISDQCRHCCW